MSDDRQRMKAAGGHFGEPVGGTKGGYAGYHQQAEPAPMPALWEARLKPWGESISRLGMLTGLLASRLEPVRSIPPEPLTGGPASAEMSPGAPLWSEIENLRLRVERVADGLARLTESLEL